MSVEVAEKAGFCFGVDRAVKMAYEQVARGERVFTYGQLIHNRDVTDDLQSKGVGCIENLDEVRAGDIVIIRAHGVSKKEMDILEGKGAKVVDATCPYVKNIHKIVRREYEAGRQIVIVGDGEHPEVRGINGWCENSAVIIKEEDDIAQLICKKNTNEAVIVAQTTIRQDFFKKIQKNIKKHFTNSHFFDTICRATYERQSSAAQLAEKSDLMLVIGGRHSSNTNKLFDVCKEKCPNTFLIENIKELQQSNLLNNNIKVGITAGASTPEWVIKEAKITMAEVTTNEMNFAEALEETLKPLNSGDIVKGVVIGITPTEVQVDIGNKYDGIIPRDELTDDPSVEITSLVTVGEEVDVYVVHVSDRDGVVTLSKKKIDAAKGMEELKEAFENSTILTGRVVELVRGGVVTIAKGVRVFIPASEAAERYLADLGTLLNTEASFRIIKMDEDRRGRRRVVGSIKSVAKEISDKKAQEFWASAEVGKQYKGIVKSLTAFGAFVDLGGVDGLIHISELSNLRIKHPSEVCKVGDEMEVFIKELDKEHNKVSIVKEFKEKKAEEFWASAEVGKKYTGVVKSLTAFGAFVDLGGVDGLVHISELSWQRIKHPSEVVKVGDEIEVYIKALDKEKDKISLGYKKEEDSPWIQATKDLKVGDTVKCKIVRILPFGAFAEIAAYVDGLIHISQISNERIGKPSDVLNIGDEVEAKIVEINDDTKQIGLSMKALLPEAPETAVEDAVEESASYTEESTFTLGDILDSETAEEAVEEAVAEEAVVEPVEETAEESTEE